MLNDNDIININKDKAEKKQVSVPFWHHLLVKAK